IDRLGDIGWDVSRNSASIDRIERIQDEGRELEAIQFEAVRVESASRMASVRTEEQARVEDGVAFASQINTVQVELGEDIAGVEQSAQASIDEQAGRINAMWSLRTDVNGLV